MAGLAGAQSNMQVRMANVSAGRNRSDKKANPSTRARFLLGISTLAGMAILYWLLARSGLIEIISDKAALRAAVDRLGIWGPITIVAMEAVAIVASPLPSAPVAVAAGAAYGAVPGGLLIVAGAVLGAITAFFIARCFGFEVIRRWEFARNYLDMLSHDHSQRWLMGAVFISRLLPFVSFDAVSYVSGLTPLVFWRFALATLTGVVPVSFMLTYAGETLVGVSTDLVLAVIAAIVAIPIIAVGVRALWRPKPPP